MINTPGEESRVTILLSEVQQFLPAESRSLLEKQPDFHIVGESEDGTTTLALVESLRPDVLIIHRMLNESDESRLIQQVLKNSPKTKIIVLSQSFDEREVLRNLRAGVKAYISTESSSKELVRAIHEVNTGRQYLGSIIFDKVVSFYLEKVEPTIKDSYSSLTHREKEILHLIGCGYSTLNIVEKLRISRNTVESHRTRILRKLSSRN
jgi:two-component system, NarL family, response regulator NreC